MWRIASEVVHVYRIKFVSISGTVHFSSTLDSRNSSPRAAKRMLQPPFQSNKVPLSAEPAKTIAKCVYLTKKRVELLCIKSSFSSATERHKKINEVETKRESCRLISVPWHWVRVVHVQVKLFHGCTQHPPSPNQHPVFSHVEADK